MCYLKEKYKNINKINKAIVKIVEIEEKITITRIMRETKLRQIEVEELIKFLNIDLNYNEIYIVIKRAIKIEKEVDRLINIYKEVGKKEIQKINFFNYIEEEEKEKIKRIYKKYENEKYLKDLNNKIEEYNNMSKYSCVKCWSPVTKLEYNKCLCKACIKENGIENTEIKCTKCGETKHIKHFPTDVSQEFGYKTNICKECDSIAYIEIRREVAYKYSLTTKGRETAKRNIAKHNERLLCKHFTMNGKTSNEMIKDYKEVDLLRIINNNPLVAEHFNENMTMVEFYAKKKELKLEFDHIIPKTYANKIYNMLGEIKTTIEEKGLETKLIEIVSNVLNNVKNIQLLLYTENNAKHNNIMDKDRDLEIEMRKELIVSIVELSISNNIATKF